MCWFIWNAYYHVLHTYRLIWIVKIEKIILNQLWVIRVVFTSLLEIDFCKNIKRIGALKLDSNAHLNFQSVEKIELMLGAPNWPLWTNQWPFHKEHDFMAPWQKKVAMVYRNIKICYSHEVDFASIQRCIFFCHKQTFQGLARHDESA